MRREKTSSRKGTKPRKKTEGRNRPAKTKKEIWQDRWDREGDSLIESGMVIRRDIHEQERMESSLKSERDRLVSILNAMTDGVYIVNQNYAIEYANPAMQREFGPFEGRKCHEYLAGEREPCSWCTWPKILAGKTIRIEWMCPRNGKIYDSIDTPLQNPDGTLSKLKIIRDITERKRMEQALRETQKDLNRAQAVAHTGSWRLDVRRNELLWSDETHRIFGVPRGTPMTYETFLATVHPEDRECVDQQWQGALRGDPYDIEHRIVVDGAVKWVRERAELDFDKEGVLLGGFGTAQDITEFWKAEEALRHSRDTLEIMVKERTTELLQANKRLKEENEERLHTEQSLRLEGARLDALLRLRHFSEASVAEIAAFVLEQGIELTQSKIGFVGFLSEDESVYTLHAVSKNVVKECNVTGDPVQWHIAGAGVWAEAIRERKTLFINDYSKPHLRKRGIPPGHPPVERFMVVPLFEGERIVVVAGVGNKTSDYDHSDERQIALLLGGMWIHVQRNRSREELQKAHDELEQKVEQRTAELAASNAALQNEITEHKQAEEALRKAKEELEERVRERTADLRAASLYARSLIEASIDPLVTISQDGKITDVNHATEQVTGMVRDQLVGSDFFDYFTEPEMARAGYEEVFREGFVRDYPLGLRHRDGHVTPVLYNASVYRNKAGEIAGVFAAARDISKRVLAERMLRESEARFHSLFENSRDPVYIERRDGTFVDFNQAMIDLFGYSREELMDKNIRDLYANPDERPKFQRFIERWGSVRDYGTRFRRKNRRVRECRVTASLRRAEDGTILGYEGIIRDVTKQRRYQWVLQNYAERLRVLSQKLLDVQENERKLIARDLHDSIGGSLSAIKFTLGRKLGQMNEGGFSGEILLENIISMVQRTIDENRRIMTELRPSLLDDLGVVETIDWFCGEFEGVYPHIRVEKHVEIEESEIPEHLKIVVFRILQEALNNVARHSKADLVHVYFGKTAGPIEIAIQDNGQGLDARTVINKGEDRGMGLSSMRERAELLGGTFSIKSKPGEGTTVRAKWEIKNN
jgi:PAS domain S-box-containing protein